MDRSLKAPPGWEAIYREVRNDIFALCRLVKFEPTHQQVELLKAVQRRDKRIAVKSGQGTGKCLPQTVEVYEITTGRRLTIGELIEAGQAISVASARTNTLKIESSGARTFDSGEKPCVRVTCASGQWVDASTDHRILTQRGWVEAQHLADGDLLAMPRSMPAAQSPEIVEDHVVRLAAYFASDGCTASRAQAGFTQMPGPVLDEFSSDVSKAGGSCAYRGRSGKAIQVGTSKMMPLIRYFGYEMCLSKNKRVPCWAYGLPNSQVALFLNRFWACDGWIDREGLAICLASEGMVRDVQFMLLRLGIHSRYRHRKTHYDDKKEFDAWHLTVTGQSNVIAFFHQIGLVLGKEAACERLILDTCSKDENTNVDIVPIRKKEMEEILEEIGIKNQRGRWGAKGLTKKMAREICRGRPNSYVSRSKFQRFCATFSYTGKYAWLASSDVLWTPFVSREDLGVLPVGDLSVPGNENFVAQNLVVHNSTASALCAIWRVIQAPGSRVIVTAPSMRQAQDVYITEVMRLVSQGPKTFQRLFYPTLRKVYIGRQGKDDDSKTDWAIQAVTATDPRNAQGYHGTNLSFMVDESSGVARPIIEQIDGTLTQATGDLLHLHTGNPNLQDCKLYDFFTKERSRWTCLTFDALTSPLVSKEHCEYMKQVYGERSDVYRIRVLGEFPTMDPNSVMSIDDLEACTKTDPIEMVRRSRVRQFGIDLARYGSDESGIAQRSGEAIVAFEMFAKTDPNDVVGRAFVMQSESAWKDDDTNYVSDADGMGQGVMDRFHKARKQIHEFHTSASPQRSDYHDKMSEAWFCLGRKVRERACHLPADRDLLQQLSTRLYSVTRLGKIKIETKDEYKKRTESGSPDRADTVVMAFYDGVVSEAQFSFSTAARRSR